MFFPIWDAVLANILAAKSRPANVALLMGPAEWQTDTSIQDGLATRFVKFSAEIKK